jgi:hypothetical protein
MSRSAAAVEKWQRIVDTQESSGQTVAEYCRQRGIAASSLFFWRRRLQPRSGAAAFVEAQVTAGTEGGETDAIEIICGQRRIAVHAGFDPDVLREAIKVLEGLPRDIGRGLPSRLETLA